MKRLLVFGAGCWLAATPAAAQTSGRATFEIPVQWISPSSEASVTRQNIAGAFTVEHGVGEERARLFYDVTLDAFGGPDLLRTWLHNGGATVAFGDERRALEVGGSLFWRGNEGEWADAGFKGVNLVAIARAQPIPGASVTATYGFYNRLFPEQPALDQVEHLGSAQTILNFSTRTTFVGHASLGSKSYDGREVLSSYVDALPSSRMRGWRTGAFVPVASTVIGEPAQRSQWSLLARVAQSLTDRIGVWVEHERRGTGGDLPPTIVWTPPMFYDDGVYDDPYVIDQRAWRGGIKQVFPAGAEVRGWFNYADREYAGLSRTDGLTRAGAAGVVPVFVHQALALEAVADYGWTRNTSSDPAESYRAHAMSLGLRLRF